MISQKDSSCLNSSQPEPSVDADANYKTRGLINTCIPNSNSNPNSNNDSYNNSMSSAVGENHNNFGQSPDRTGWTQQTNTNSHLGGSSNFVVQTTNNTSNINAGSQGGAGLANVTGLGNMSELNTNGNLFTSNIGNIPAPDSIGNNGGADDMQWLEQALKNPQLASSAKFLLETTNFINSCIRPSGNEVGHENALTGSTFANCPNSIPPKIQVVSNSNGNGMTNGNAMMNRVLMQTGFTNCSNNIQPQNPLGMQNQLQDAWSQGNFTLNSSINTAVLHQSTRDILSRPNPSQMCSPRRQGACSVLSVSSQTSGPNAYMINQNTMLNNNMMPPANNFPAQSTNNNLQYMHQQHQLNAPSDIFTPFENNNGQHQQQQHAASLSCDSTMNSFQRQQFVTQSVNLLPQHQFVDLQNGSKSFADTNHATSSRNSQTSLDDELNNLDPEDYRQEASEDFDLSFLLDEASPEDRADNRNARNGAMGKDDGLSTYTNQNQSMATPAQKVNTPNQSEPQGSQPGSSQQMQEHLREITKQHMQKFQMAHTKQQPKHNKKQKSSRVCSNDAKATHQDDTRGSSSVNSIAQQPIRYEGITIPGTMKACSGNLSALGGIDSQTDPSLNYAHSTELFVHGNRHQYLPAVGGGMKRKRGTSILASNPRMPEMKSLYEYIESMLGSRGYSLIKLPAKDIGYMTPPSPLQTASFGFAICSSIKKGGAGRLSVLLASGLSPNPVNKFGDSPFFLACKRGLPDLIKTFLDHGTDVRVADGFGRTALHYVAWSNDPCFASAKLLLTADARLICVMDNHGNTPLDFVSDNNKYVCRHFVMSAL